jgi:hypothetical protein
MPAKCSSDSEPGSEKRKIRNYQTKIRANQPEIGFLQHKFDKNRILKDKLDRN